MLRGARRFGHRPGVGPILAAVPRPSPWSLPDPEDEDEERLYLCFFCPLPSFLCLRFFSLPSCRGPDAVSRGTRTDSEMQKAAPAEVRAGTFLLLCFLCFFSLLDSPMLQPQSFVDSRRVSLQNPPFLFLLLPLLRRDREDMSSDCLQNADKIRILVLGDSGVGKTSLVELLCSGTELRKPRSTVGCAIHMKIHESPSTVAPAPVCGSCPSHALSCGVAARRCSAACSCCALDTSQCA